MSERNSNLNSKRKLRNVLLTFLVTAIFIAILVYGVTNVDGSGYNRIDDNQDIKSKVGGAIINGEYRSQKMKASI